MLLGISLSSILKRLHSRQMGLWEAGSVGSLFWQYLLCWRSSRCLELYCYLLSGWRYRWGPWWPLARDVSSNRHRRLLRSCCLDHLTHCSRWWSCSWGHPSQCITWRNCSRGHSSQCSPWRNCSRGHSSQCSPWRSCSRGKPSQCGPWRSCSRRHPSHCSP